MAKMRWPPDPAGGAYSAPPDPLAAIRGPTSKGRGGKGRGGREGRKEGRISPYQSTFASGAHAYGGRFEHNSAHYLSEFVILGGNVCGHQSADTDTVVSQFKT